MLDPTNVLQGQDSDTQMYSTGLSISQNLTKNLDPRPFRTSPKLSEQYQSKVQQSEVR